MKRKLWIVGLAAALTVCCTNKSRAQINAAASGNWTAAGTWTPAAPVAGDWAHINDGFTVDINQVGAVANILDVGSSATETGSLTVANSGSLTVGTTLRVGQTASSGGNVNMTGGTVTVNGVAGSAIGNGELIVGDVGNGTWTQSGGDLITADEIFVGLGNASTSVVDVSGGTFKSGGRSTLVGFGGNGTLNVSGTAAVTANHDLLLAFLPGSVGNLNQSGGTIEAGFLFTNIDGNPAGSTAFINQTGGTFNTRIAFVLGQRAGTTTMNHSGGTVNVLRGAGEFVVGDGPINSSTYNISGSADVNILRNFVAGRDGIGTVTMSGGTIDAANVFLGDFDTSHGTMTISGGTLSLSGNLNVGAALASNAPPAPVGTAGQALDANGTLTISGPGGMVNVLGNLLANPDDNTRFGSLGEHNDAALVFVATSGGLSTINVSGVADLTGAEIDLDLLSTYPLGTSFDLITASAISADFHQVAEDVGQVALRILAGGNGQILRATLVPEPLSLVMLATGIVGLWGSRRQRGC